MCNHVYSPMPKSWNGIYYYDYMGECMIEALKMKTFKR
jgi:hypothetical protein